MIGCVALPFFSFDLRFKKLQIKSQYLIGIKTLAKGSSAHGTAASEVVGTEPLSVEPAVVHHRVLGPVQAPVGVAPPAAVAELVQEASGGYEGHNLILVHRNLSTWVRFVQSAQLSVDV